MLKFLKLEWKWLEVSDNRKKTYRFLRFGAAPILIAAGFATPNQVAVWLDVASGLLLFSSNTVAERNVK
jgi:hypothetical protein